MEAVASVLIAAVVGPVVVLYFQRRWKDETAAGQAETAAGQADLVSKIGEPNGHGSLVAMTQALLDGHQALLEGHQALLEGQARQDDRLARMEARQAGTDEKLVAIQVEAAAAAKHGVETRKLLVDHLADQ